MTGFAWKSAAAERPLTALATLACLVHLAMFCYDWVSNFGALLTGDRGYTRFETMQKLASQPWRDYLPTMVEGKVIASEYLFQLPAYLLGGIPALVLFQMVLTILSVLCVARMAGSLFPWRCSAFFFGLIYLLIPQNLVAPHQLVTEATAVPFCVFFLYFIHSFFTSASHRKLMFSALFLGLAIFIRPSLSFVLPIMVVLALMYGRAGIFRHGKATVAIAAVACLPLALWVLLFTAVTGDVGYTKGVANLGWNLRSKVFLVETTNGLAKSPEVMLYHDYSDLYGDNGGILVGRFVSIACRTPLPFLVTAATDALIVFGKGNSTKITVDYFGLARDQHIKEWRDHLSGGIGELVRWAMTQTTMIMVFALEILWSILVSAASMTALAFICGFLLFPKRLAAFFQPWEMEFILIVTSLFFTVLLNAEMVDRAQARLRHPAEAGILLLVGMAMRYVAARRSASTRS